MQWNNVPEIDYQFSVCVLLTISIEGQLVCWYVLCNSGISRQASHTKNMNFLSFFLSSTCVCSNLSYTNNYVLSVWLWRFKVHGFFGMLLTDHPSWRWFSSEWWTPEIIWRNFAWDCYFQVRFKTPILNLTHKVQMIWTLMIWKPS